MGYRILLLLIALGSGVSAWAAETPDAPPSDEWIGSFVAHQNLASGLAPACEPSCDDVATCDGVPSASCQSKSAPKPNPCATSHKGVFYANDFKYLNDPNYCGCCLGDALKQLDVGCRGKLDVGGQYRARYHHEVGMKGTERFLNTHDDFLLNRLRLYGNYVHSERVRVFVEGIFADSSGQNYPPRSIDLNYWDVLNGFVDVKLTDSGTLRIGRQELLYGAQRTVSPLDWANTRRTFEGIRYLYKRGDWAADLFYTNLVVVNPVQFDKANYDQSFYGLYSTYSGLKNGTAEFYYLGYDNQTALFSLHTLGSRLIGAKNDWLWEFEGAYQFGDAAGVGVNQDAGFATAGFGRAFKDRTWKPTLWAYFDYASGNAAGSNSFNGYNQLFPLAHKYLGFIDALQRTNIESPNLLLTMSPSDKMKLLVWYYYFQSNTGAPITSIGGTPTNQSTSKDVGQELDFILTYQLQPRAQILFGYSHFWPGNKLVTAQEADFIYSQFTLNF